MKLIQKPSKKYMVPDILKEKEHAIAWLKDKGVAQPHKHVDELYYLLYTIRVKTLNRESCPSGWAPLMGEVLRELFGNKNRYIKIRDGLEQDRLIEVDHRAWSREQKTSKRYRLGTALKNVQWHYVEVGGCLTARLLEQQEKVMLPVDRALKTMLRHIRLPYDPIAESGDYNRKTDTMLGTVNYTYRLFYFQCSKDQFEAYLLSYQKVKAGDDTYKVGEFGRRHNLVTNMPKMLRGGMYAEIDGVRLNLKHLDIRNSQVLLLLTIIKGKTEAEDFYKFKDDVQSGEFYERLAFAFGRRFGDVAGDERDRSRFKEAFFAKYLYGDNTQSYVQRSGIYKAFSKRYPTVHAIIEDYKNRHGYAALAQAMQRLEATIIVKEVCHRLLLVKKTRAKFVAQVYDSIIVDEEHAQTAKMLIEQSFAKRMINVSVSIK